jgi:hypothetical protein
MTQEYTELDRLLDRYLAAENTSNHLSDLTDARQALNEYVAAKDATIDRMLRERSGRRYGDFIEYPETTPFAFEIEWGEAGYPIEIVLSMMDADDRAAFVGRVSQLLYRYMGDSPHAQAMAIMKDLTGEPS